MTYEHDQYKAVIRKHLTNCLTETHLELPDKKRGKVRDSYRLGEKMVFVTTDRQSAFDRILASVPFKGQVLNLTSAWWFKQTEHIVPNHLLSIPDPNTMIAESCTVFPIEFVIRGYITGTTHTSLWTQYQRGVRNYCGVDFPEGLVKNQKLTDPVLTPTTKAEDHDQAISPQAIIDEGWMSREDWDLASRYALDLFTFGQQTAEDHGLLLVDTKYEMGKDADGNILLIDEIHTPDSSRYWLQNSYEQRFKEGLEPENIDKEFLRLWFVEHCDPYDDVELPKAPEELVIELSYRYIQLYERITGNSFAFPEPSEDTVELAERLQKNLEFLWKE